MKEKGSPPQRDSWAAFYSVGMRSFECESPHTNCEPSIGFQVAMIGLITGSISTCQKKHAVRWQSEERYLCKAFPRYAGIVFSICGGNYLYGTQFDEFVFNSAENHFPVF
jgi:hypothetical protein